jgi:hypothetical protein
MGRTHRKCSYENCGRYRRDFPTIVVRAGALGVSPVIAGHSHVAKNAVIASGAARRAAQPRDPSCRGGMPTGLTQRNIITLHFFNRFSGVSSRPMHDPVSPGTTLLAMSATNRIAAALLVSAVLWLAAWWAL